MRKFIALFGPTAVGKTKLTEDLFSDGFEIVNADSVQIYRYLDIGSAKPGKDLMVKIPHHLVDIKDPWEEYSSGLFVQDATSAIDDIISRGKMPLLTGGTGYYFRQLMYGQSEAPAADPDVRQRVRKEIGENGSAWAFEKLKEVDPISSKRIHPNDKYRISRALEVYYSSSMPLSSFALPDRMKDDLDVLVIALRRDKEELDERIRMRIDRMFEEGFPDEIERLKEMGASPDWPSMDAIGYREALSGYSDPDELKEAIYISTRKYAKRQMTFFRSFKEAHWFHPDEKEKIREAVFSFLSSEKIN